MKPGEYATSVEVATEKVVATTDTPIYGGYGALGSAMAFMYWLTGDERYIEPFMHVWRRGIDRTSPGNLLPEMFHRGALDKLGGETFLKLVQGRGIAEWLVTGDKHPLVEALKKDIAELQRFLGHVYDSRAIHRPSFPLLAHKPGNCLHRRLHDPQQVQPHSRRQLGGIWDRFRCARQVGSPEAVESAHLQLCT